MSVDVIAGQPPSIDTDHPTDAVHDHDVPSQADGGQPPQVIVLTGVATDTVETLLLSVARGNQEAFITLQSRMVGLIRVNVRRVLHDASRSEAVTQETFAEVLEEAVHFDPARDSAETWLLTRAHRHAVDGLRCVDDTDDPQRPEIDQSASVRLP